MHTHLRLVKIVTLSAKIVSTIGGAGGGGRVILPSMTRTGDLLQVDTSGRTKPPVDIDLKVAF